MRCKKARILVSASLDGELSRRQQIVLERHLSACSGCAEEKARFSALRDTMSVWADEEPSERLPDSFARRLQLRQEKPAAKPLAARWLLGTAAAGAATALVMVGFLLHGLLVRPVAMPPVPTKVVKSPAATEKSTVAQTPRAEQEKAAASGASSSETVRAAAQSAQKHYAKQSYPRTHSSLHSDRPEGLASRRPAGMAEPQKVVATTITEAEVAQGAVAAQLTENLGEAELAMNEMIERVRGTLQKTVDLIVSEFPAPADDTLDSDGGSTP